MPPACSTICKPGICRAADSNGAHGLLEEAKIKPLIQMRALWKEEPERMLPGHDGTWRAAGCDRQLVRRDGAWQIESLQEN